METRVENFLATAVYNFFDKINRFFEKKPKRKTYTIAALALTAFLLMFILNIFTPYAADDFGYHFIIEEDGSWGDRVESFADVVVSMKNHYNQINGRIILHGILQYVLMYGKTVFDVLNSAMFAALALLVYKHCKGTSKKSSPLLFLAILIMLWAFLPSSGMTTLWASGSVNYMWSSVIRLSVLLPFRLWADKGRFKIPAALMAVIMVLLSAVAGATNENSSAAFIGMCALFIIVYKIRKIKIPVWAFTSLAGSLAGFVFMITAPGNFSRVDSFTSVKASLLFRLFNIPAHFIIYLFAPICVFAVFYLIQRKLNPEPAESNTLVAAVYLLGSVGGAAVMIASPYFPARAWTSMAVCVIIAAGMMLYRAEFSFTRSWRNAVAFVATLCCICCVGSYVQLGTDSIEITQKVNARETYIEEQKAEGNYDVVLSKISSDNPRSCFYSLSDISENPKNWSNEGKALYYGLNSITAE